MVTNGTVERYDRTISFNNRYFIGFVGDKYSRVLINFYYQGKDCQCPLCRFMLRQRRCEQPSQQVLHGLKGDGL